MIFLSATAYGQGTFIAVGQGGTILQSAQVVASDLRVGPVFAQEATITFLGTGSPDETWTIQASTNLMDWVPFAELPSTNTVMPFTDFAAPNYARRFYRGKTW